MDTSVSDSPKRKPRNALTLAERIKVIERKEKGESTKSIAAAFCVGLTQIVNIYANKQKLKEKWERGDSAKANQTKRRKCPYVVEYMMRLADDIQKQRLRKRTIESKQSLLTTYLDKD